MQNTRVNHLLEKILSNNVLPQIALYTTITERSATLIDGIFTNSYGYNFNCVSSNNYLHFRPSFSVFDN